LFTADQHQPAVEEQPRALPSESCGGLNIPNAFSGFAVARQLS
jgi:hypothetical protein